MERTSSFGPPKQQPVIEKQISLLEIEDYQEEAEVAQEIEEMKVDEIQVV